MNCDKCGLPVNPKNDAISVAVAAGEITPLGLLTLQPRHFLPEGVCPGSPSRAQYIGGQPRDSRGYPYNKAEESKWRAAYEQVQNAK